MAIAQSGFGFLCETDGGNIWLVDVWANTTKICEIYLFAYEQWGVEMGKNKTVFTKCISNGNCTTGFGLICVTDGGRLLFNDSLSPHNSNMWDIFISICSVRGWNGK